MFNNIGEWKNLPPHLDYAWGKLSEVTRGLYYYLWLEDLWVHRVMFQRMFLNIVVNGATTKPYIYKTMEVSPCALLSRDGDCRDNCVVGEFTEPFIYRIIEISCLLKPTGWFAVERVFKELYFSLLVVYRFYDTTRSFCILFVKNIAFFLFFLIYL